MARPREQKSQALLDALKVLIDQGLHPSLRELSHQSLVAVREARWIMSSLVRAGHVEITGFRRVQYRNRPIAEYGFPSSTPELGHAALESVLRCWT